MSHYKTAKRLISDYIFDQQKNKIKAYGLILFGIITYSIAILEPLFMKNLIDIIENFIKTGKYKLDDFLIIFLFWGLFIIFITTLRGLYDYYLEKNNLISHNKMYNNFVSTFMNMKYGQYLNKKGGTTFKIIDKGMDFGFFFIQTFFTQVLDAVVSLVMISTLLIYIDWRMAIVTLLMVPVMFLIGVGTNLKTSKMQKKVDDIWNGAFGDFGDGLQNLGLVKILNLENKISNRFYKKIKKAYKNQLFVSKRWIIAELYTSVIVMTSKFLVLSMGIYLIISGEIGIAILFLYISYIGYIYYPLGFLFKSLKSAQKQLTGIAKLYEEYDNILLDSKNENKKNILKNIKGNIEFKNVIFNYNKDRNIFKDLSFSMKAGEKVAFVGNTGAGKSTIVSLLFRFWDINSGEITIDGKNINNISKESLRQNIGLVMQDNSLFNTSIKENLKFANSKASTKDIEKALKNAEANFVFELKDGINTIIGERGLKLSGGEKQRLSIARLFLKNPKILILDEATSALDNKTEKLVQKALDKLTIGRTSIVIAHRLSTIQNADKIFMLENGKIVETGNYEELMKNKSKFFELANPEHLILN